MHNMRNNGNICYGYNHLNEFSQNDQNFLNHIESTLAEIDSKVITGSDSEVRKQNLRELERLSDEVIKNFNPRTNLPSPKIIKLSFSILDFFSR